MMSDEFFVGIFGHPYAIAFLTPPIVLFGVVGIFIGRRLRKNEKWRPIGTLLILISIIGIITICSALYSVRDFPF